MTTTNETMSKSEAWREQREQQAKELLRALRMRSRSANYSWGADMSVEAGLLLEGFRFEFVQAVRLLLDVATRASQSGMAESVAATEPGTPPRLPQVEHAPEEELLQEEPHASLSLPRMDRKHNRVSLRLRSRVAFDFPPASVHAIRLSPDVVGQIEIIANLMALAGNNAPLPEPFAEMLLASQKVRDMAMTDFLDIFHHRLLELYYSTTVHTAPWISNVHPAGNDLAQIVYALAGLGPAGLRRRMQVPDRTWLRYAGLLWHRPRSAAALAQILTDHFKVKIRLGKAVGRWFAMEEEDRCRLGRNTCVLGKAAIGTRVWIGDAGILLHIGPLKSEAFLSFLPGGRFYRQLLDMLRFYVRDNVTADLDLQIAPGETASAAVGGARLGWTSWLHPSATGQPLRLRVRNAA
jgi:type VI secretion system protein ImpH